MTTKKTHRQTDIRWDKSKSIKWKSYIYMIPCYLGNARQWIGLRLVSEKGDLWQSFDKIQMLNEPARVQCVKKKKLKTVVSTNMAL